MDEVMTVDVAMDRLERLEGYGLAVHPERCVRVRNRHASCARCAEACTSGALSLRDGALTVDEALCVGCGTCATVCPTCAIEARHPVDGELLAAAHRALRAGREAVFACHRAFEQAPAACAAAGAIELACLSRMEESLAMRLFADGAQCIRLLHGACEGCPRENGFASVKLVRDTVDSLLETWGLNCEYDVQQVGSEVKVAAADAAEPQLVATSGIRAASALRKPAHVQADGTLPHFVPLRRHALLDALADLGNPVRPDLDTRLWGHVSIDMGACRSCKMCAVFCPTGALKKSDIKPSPNADGTPDGGSFLEFSCAECVQCGLCVDACMKKCITVSPVVSTAELFDFEPRFIYLPKPQARPGILSGIRR